MHDISQHKHVTDITRLFWKFRFGAERLQPTSNPQRPPSSSPVFDVPGASEGLKDGRACCPRHTRLIFFPSPPPNPVRPFAATPALFTSAMASSGARTQRPVGSAAWVSTEKENISQLVEQEMEEVEYPVAHEMDWLNEHMAEIFENNNLYVCHHTRKR